MNLVQGFQVPQKQSGQIAHFATGEMNTVQIAEIVADFLALAMVEETLDPSERHNVISDRPSWNEMRDDGECSAGNKGSGGVRAFRRTDVYGFANLDGTVLYGLAGV
jgi:hypothetical protein